MEICNILCGFMILMGKLFFLYTTQEKENRNFVVIYFVCSYFLYKNLVVQKSSLYENYESEVLLKTSITCYNVCIILCFR